MCVAVHAASRRDDAHRILRDFDAAALRWARIPAVGVEGTARCDAPRPLRPGKRRVVQGRLVERGARLVVDGRFGRNTAGAVRAFQSPKGREADGVVGPKTWEALWILPA